MNEDEQDWNFPFEEPLHEVFPQLHAAQNAWMAQIDSLKARVTTLEGEVSSLTANEPTKGDLACAYTTESRAPAG